MTTIASPATSIPHSTHCPLLNHFNKPITLICTNPKCQNKRLLCLKCLTLDHRDCLDFILEVDDVYDRTFLPNLNWINDHEVKKAIKIIAEYQLNGPGDQLRQLFENLLDKEFAKIQEYFQEKILEQKAKILDDFRATSDFEMVNIEGFMKHLQELYNFDSFISILQSLHKEDKSIELLNKELETFLLEISAKEIQQKSLIELAQRLNRFTKNYLTSDSDTIEKFKHSIDFHILDDYPLRIKKTSWDPFKKSQRLEILENNTIARRLDDIYEMTAVLGITEMEHGHYQWEVEVNTKNPQHQWILFGVADKNLGKNLEAFNYREAMGLSTFGQFYNMTKVEALNDYDNKTYLCYLDFSKGLFTISFEGKVVAKGDKDLKGNNGNKVLVPYAILTRRDNMIRLQMK